MTSVHEWADAVDIAPSKKAVSLRIDAEVVEFFKEQGPGYQTRINAVLRAYMIWHKNKEG